VDLSHLRTGSGPPLLLLHGLGMSKAVWRPLLPLLAAEREVIAIDMPGFGDSPPGPRTVEGLAHAVVGFTHWLGIDRPHVAGNSLGGGVALSMGAAGHARSVCALSPVGFIGDREGKYARSLLAATRGMSRVLRPVADPLARTVVARTALASHACSRPWRVPPDEMAQWTRDYARTTAFWPLLDALDAWRAPTPTCPTTVAWGERDRILITSRQAPRAARLLPQARHVPLRGCGHVPMWDDPEQVARVMLDASR
jgi:pimeloyl-ACP methyl ester carboxylesterase